MLFDITDDQEFFRSTTAKFLAARVPQEKVRELRHDEHGFGAEYWRGGAELGWTSLLVGEEAGGGSISGRPVVDLTLIAYEFGRHAAPGPLVPGNIVAAALAENGSHAEVLAELLSGESIATWCHAEAAPQRGVGLEIRVDGDELVLNGGKQPVESAGVARYLLVTGLCEGGLTQVLVPVESRGVTVTPLRSPDLTRRFSAVAFDDVRVPRSALVGVPGAAAEQIARQEQIAVVVQCAETVGAMQTGFEMVLDWMADRYSFGRPLASYQALKHRTADLKSWLEAAHAIADRAAAAVGEQSPESDELVDVAQAFIGHYGPELLQDCVQLHGGIGLTFEHDLHLFLRRATVNRTLYGTPAQHRRRIADRLIEQDAASASDPGALGQDDRGAPDPSEQARGVAAPEGEPGGALPTPDESASPSGGTVVAERDDPGQTGLGDRPGTTTEPEAVESFRLRARAWIRANLGPYRPEAVAGLRKVSREEELAAVGNDRRLQRKLYDAGFAGIAIPVEYGGQGLTVAHQRAFTEEMAGFEYPSRCQVPTLSPCAAVLLDFGTEEQKRRHIPAMLRGEEIWMQFLSEPSGGSDVAGAVTTAVRDGADWVLNGAKIWTTGAWYSDWALCLARTNWDVPKHRGLTVFILPIHQPGIEVHQIEMLNGAREFCQEFLTDVRVPDSDRIGEVDGGWTVGTRWMSHERLLSESPYVTVPAKPAISDRSPVEIACRAGTIDEPGVRDLIGEDRMLDIVGTALQRRLGMGMATGRMPEQSAGIGRLFRGIAESRRATIEFEVAGDAVWDGEFGDTADVFLMRQVSCIGGGTTEMARNVISERVLGMPREARSDNNVPFREVPRGGRRT
ncbi:acyl-CoA dehydrogenase [Nocardia sp. CA-290969]|uniref:acyl-CoA dehydrogenase n=1 Tax=Nocardia sp. CA-290969 TaxID=3239986 RepID=UPI003D927C42